MNNKNIFSGLSAVKEIRISGNSTGMPHVFYKYDTSQPGWYPKPFERKNQGSWNRVFQHEDPLQGAPIAVSESPCYERGFKQHCKYKVEYSGESMNINI